MSTENVSIAAAKSLTKDALNSFSLEKTPILKPPEAFRVNVLSQNICGVRLLLLLSCGEFELIELVELELEGFNITSGGLRKERVHKGEVKPVLDFQNKNFIYSLFQLYFNLIKFKVD